MQKKYIKEQHIQECISELIDCENGEGEDGCDISSDWVKLVSRGGLLHMKNSTYQVFYSMEKATCQLLLRNTTQEFYKHTFIDPIKQDEYASFFRCLASIEMENENSTSLFSAIVEQWVIMRGFAFASAWVELYKQECSLPLKSAGRIRFNGS